MHSRFVEFLTVLVNMVLIVVVECFYWHWQELLVMNKCDLHADPLLMDALPF